MAEGTIATRVDEFDAGFTEQIGPQLSAVFADEQRHLTDAGLPDGVVHEGDTVDDAPLVAADGTAVRLSDALSGSPAVLVFYRGAWCPYCNITLRAYQEELAAPLRDRGVRLVAISPQTPDGSAAAVENGSLEYTVLSDPAARLISALGIRTEPSAEARAAHTELGFDVADSNTDGTAGIPYPTVLVVDADRVVRFADVRVDYTTRTESAEVLAAIDGAPLTATR